MTNCLKEIDRSTPLSSVKPWMFVVSDISVNVFKLVRKYTRLLLVVILLKTASGLRFWPEEHSDSDKCDFFTVLTLDDSFTLQSQFTTNISVHFLTFSHCSYKSFYQNHCTSVQTKHFLK